MSSNNLIFLISQPRSGSTLLQRILNKHSEIATVGEPWMLLPIIKEDFELNIRKNASYNESFAKGAIKEFENEVSDLKKIQKQLFLKYYTEICSSISKDFKCSLFLDKTPRYYYIINEVKELFPQSKIIILSRNPLDILNSILKTWIRGNYGFMKNFFDDLFKAPMILSSSIDDDRVYHMQYEDLLSSPLVVVKDLCSYLGINFEDEMLNVSDSVDWVFGDPNMNIKKNISAVNKEIWKSKMTAQKWRLFNEYINSSVSESYELLGYDVKKTRLQLQEIKPSPVNMFFTIGFKFLKSPINTRFVYPIQFYARKMSSFLKFIK